MIDTRTRMLKIAQLLYGGQKITSRFIADHFGVSLSTGKRDVTLIEQALPVRCGRSDREGVLHWDHERALYLPAKARR